MSTSTHVVGYRPADEKWVAMKTAWDACELVGVPIPDAVLRFFDGEYPDEQPGKEVGIVDAVRKWSTEGRSGYEVDVTHLPKDVRFIHFYTSW